MKHISPLVGACLPATFSSIAPNTPIATIAPIAPLKVNTNTNTEGDPINNSLSNTPLHLKLLIIVLVVNMFLIIYNLCNIDLLILDNSYNSNLFHFYGPDSNPPAEASSSSSGGSNTSSSQGAPTDPRSIWPTGVPQAWGVLASGLAVYSTLQKLGGVSPRGRILAALGAMGTTASTIVGVSIIENSVGFNRFMHGLTIYKQTKVWPSVDVINKATEDEVRNSIAEKVAAEAAQAAQVETSNISLSQVEITLTSHNIPEAERSEILAALGKYSKKYIPELNFDLTSFLDKLFDNVFSILQPVKVTGYLDDLIGQQLAIQVICLVLICSAILTFTAFLINIIFYINKEYLISKFKNKYIHFYIKYQSFFARLSLIYLPIFVFINLFTLLYLVLFMLSHPIPYELLGENLHVFVKNSEIVLDSTPPPVG